MDNHPTLEQMNECLRIFHLEPKPIAQAAEDLLDALSAWLIETGQEVANDKVNDAYSILRQAVAAEKEKAQ